MYILLYFPFFVFLDQKAVYTQHEFNKYVLVVTITSRQNLESAWRIMKG